MAVCTITASLGNFDKLYKPVKQSVPCDHYSFTDKNFPPRHRSMTPRLQARIVKCFGWQMVPEHEIYLWVDGSCQLRHEDSVKWFRDKLGDADIAVFRHPHRKTIYEEAEYLRKRLEDKCDYITPRYENELLEEQIEAVRGYHDDRLYATTALIYRNEDKVKDMMVNWWYHISRYHTIDQLSLPYCLFWSRCKVNVIEDDFMNTPYLTPRR